MIALTDSTIYYCTCANYYSGGATSTMVPSPCPIHSLISTWTTIYDYKQPTPKKEKIIPKWWHYFETFCILRLLYTFPIIKSRNREINLIRRIMFSKSGYLPKKIRRIRKSKGRSTITNNLNAHTVAKTLQKNGKLRRT